MFNIWKILIALFLPITLLGCSGVNDPVNPELEPTAFREKLSVNQWNWGSWVFYVSSDHTRIEVIPQRYAEYHYCVTKFVEVYPCNDCLTIGKPQVQADWTVKLKVTLRHPFPNAPHYTGFDVRGMVYFPSTRSYKTNLEYDSLIYKPGFAIGVFPNTGSKMPLTFSRTEDGGGELLNADGYSCYLIPGVTYSPDWPIFSYQPGKHGIEPTPQLTTINPYKVFASDLQRRMFRVNDQITREYHIALPEGEFCFGYAVDASWWPPDNTPVTDPANDFPREANSEDPWWIEYEQLLPVSEENEGKDCFKATVHHRGIEESSTWEIYLYAWDLSIIGQESQYPQFGFLANDVIDDFTTTGYGELQEGWWFIYGESGKAIPGHHLGVLIAWSNPWSPDPKPKGELLVVYGVRFVDIYVEE